MKSISSLRFKKNMSLYFSYIVLLSSFVSVLIQLISSMNASKYGYTTLIYFTIQSNLFVSLISLVFILKKHSRQWFKYLSFITLINISITALVFHSMLTPYMESVGILQQMLHTINPLLYIFFYFIFVDSIISFKSIWISLVYPLLYMVFVFGFVSPLLGDIMESSSSSMNSGRYVYPFLNPNNYDNDYIGLLIFNLLILAPSILILSGILIYIKQKYEKTYLSK